MVKRNPTEKRLLDLSLPKWPQMIVTGHPVTVTQAKEIIRRTDSFFVSPYFSGNDKQHQEKLIKLFNIPEQDIYDKWQKKWKFINTNYVRNDWIACSFIYGPHGWCHPSGAVGFVDNVGKWVHSNDVYEDWKKLARTFPFLNLGVTLMSGESCEEDTSPVISFEIQKGKVRVINPAEENVHKNHPKAIRSDNGERYLLFKERYLSSKISKISDYECAIKNEWFLEWEREFCAKGKKK